MYSPEAATQQRSGYWPIPLARAVPAAAAALAITFSADHSSGFGLVTLGVLAIAWGLVGGVLAWMRLGGTGIRNLLGLQGLISVVLGLVALLVRGEGVAALFAVLAAWLALGGALELYAGLRSRGRHVASGDLVTVGAITAIAAIVVVLIPVDYRQEFSGPDGVKRVLDASVVAVGLLGAFSAIIAMYLVIAGFSAKFGPQATTPVTAPSQQP